MDEKRKTLLFIIPSLSSGGAEKTVANLSEILKDKYNIKIIIFNHEIKYNVNVPVLSIKNSKIFILGKILNFLKRIKFINKVKKDDKVWCTISFLEGPSLYNVLTRQKDKIIVSMRNTMSFQAKSLFRKFRLKYILKKSDKIIALSEMVKYDLIKNFNGNEDKIDVIYNPIDIGVLQKKSKEKVEEELIEKLKGRKIIVNIGRLCHQKGQWHLINSFKMVCEKYPDSLLLILGKGEKEEELKKLVSDLKINDKVIFLGFCDNPYKYMKNSDVFVFSSIYEGLGNALLEACGVGIPIISTDCKYGPREILNPDSNLMIQTNEIEEGEYGILVPPFCGGNTDVEVEVKLADAICRLFENNNKYELYRRKSAERATKFDNSSIKKEWIKIID